MTTYNTGNAVPSTDPRDLYDNAQALDEAVNSTAGTFTDRLGNERTTLFRAVELGMASVSVYPDHASGVAAVGEGGYFCVPAALDTEFLVLYRVEGGTYVEKKRLPSVVRIDEIQGQVGAAESNISALDGRLDTAENDINTVEGRATALEGRTTAAEGDIAALEGRATTLETRATTLEGRSTEAEADIGTLEGRATALEGRTTTAEADIDTLEGRATAAESDIDTLQLQVSELQYVPPAIETLLIDGAASKTVETGSSVASVALAWTLSGAAPDSQSIDNGVGSVPVGTLNKTVSGPFTGSQTWTLTVGDTSPAGNPAQDTAQISLLFRQKRYWGVSANPSLSSADILGLSSEFATARGKSVTYDATGGRYPYYCYPASWGALGGVTVGGLAFSDYTESVQSFTNSSGHTEDYRVIRFNSLQNGANIPVVWS